MSFETEKDADRRRKSEASAENHTPVKRGGKTKKADSPEVGQALRSIYDRTVGETIPPEMLDLLGKLG